MQNFSIFVPLIFWAGKFFIVEGCPVHYRTFSSNSGLYSLDANSECDNQKLPQTRQMSGGLRGGGGQKKLPLVENHCHKSIDPRNLINPKQKKCNQTISVHIKILKTSEKEKILKAARQNI